MAVNYEGIGRFHVRIKSSEGREAANVMRHGSEDVSGKRGVGQVVNCVPTKTMPQHSERGVPLKEVVRAIGPD